MTTKEEILKICEEILNDVLPEDDRENKEPDFDPEELMREINYFPERHQEKPFVDIVEYAMLYNTTFFMAASKSSYSVKACT